MLQTLNMHSRVIAEKRSAEELAPVHSQGLFSEIQDGRYRKFAYIPNAPETKAIEKSRSDYQRADKE